MNLTPQRFDNKVFETASKEAPEHNSFDHIATGLPDLSTPFRNSNHPSVLAQDKGWPGLNVF